MLCLAFSFSNYGLGSCRFGSSLRALSWGSPHLNADDSSFGKIFDCGVDNALKLKNRIYFTLEECLDILRKKEKYNDLQLHAKRKAEEHFKDDPDNEGTLSDNHSGITGFWQNDFGEGGFESV